MLQCCRKNIYTLFKSPINFFTMSDTKKFIFSEQELQKVYTVDRDQINDLFKLKYQFEHEASKIRLAIDSLQDICSHQYEVKETTPHFTEEQCKHCLKIRNI